MNSELSNKFIQIDEEGYFHFAESRVSEQKDGYELFDNLRISDNQNLVTVYKGQSLMVEAFDQPLVAREITKLAGNKWEISLPYDYKQIIDLNTLCLDEWDRFLGQTNNGVPFVLNHSAQAEFFNALDSFDDDSVTIDGQKILTGPWLKSNTDTANESFWTNIYNTEDPGWDIKQPHPSLKSTLSQLKLNKCRILNLGCGTGTDAQYLASLGHIVTAVDFSPEAIKQAKEKYKDINNLRFIQKDLFDISADEFGEFDLIYEHTLYCAISPDLRNQLVKKWKQMLTETGQLLGIFFAMHKRSGPPFGGSEWEIKQRLKKDFRFLYWTRCKQSPGKRLGKELIVFAEKYTA